MSDLGPGLVAFGTIAAVGCGVVFVGEVDAARGRSLVRDRLPIDGAVGAGSEPAWARRWLTDAGLGSHARHLYRGWVASVIALTVFAVALPAARILVVIVAVGAPVAVRCGAGRAARARRRQIPAALDAIASGLRAGSSLAGAIGGAAVVGPPVGLELAAIEAANHGGRRLADAIAEWGDATTDPDSTLAASALVMAAELGGPGARAVDAAARSIRERHAADAEVAALATQARLSALVLTVAPAAFAVVLVGFDEGAAHFLLTTPAGWACTGTGIALDGVGAWWMQRLVAGSAR